MSTFHINVLSAVKRESKNVNASGVKSKWVELQGLMAYEDGRMEVFVYSMWPKRGEEPADIEPGNYVPVVELRADWKTRTLQADIVKLVPVQASVPSGAANSSKPRAAAA